MAFKVIVMPAAAADLEEYAACITQDSPRSAREWLAKAWDRIFSLNENPKRFALIPEADELGVELRDMLHYSHRIIYWVRDEEQVVEILRVYHGARRPLTESELQRPLVARDRPMMLADDQGVLVRARGVRVGFGGIEVVRGVDLELRAGEVHAIVGENGAGKSTLAKVVAGVHRPDSGTIEVRGRVTTMENPRDALRLGIALIHQEPLTFPDLSVAENIFVGHLPVGGRLNQVSWGEMRRRSEEILGLIGVTLDPRARVGGLSVADQQMVELAAALSHDAKVVLLDETTAALTPNEVEHLFAIVRRLKEQGAALAFVSHRLEEIFAIADRITVMRDGVKVGERLPKETSVEEIVAMMVGRNLDAPSARVSSSETLKPILKVRGLSSPPRFYDVSFDLRPGEIVGLAGLVGAGRTEVCQALFGVLKASAGTIEVGGKVARASNPRAAMRLGIALVPEDRQHDGLLLPMPIVHNASLAALRRFARLGWVNRGAESNSAKGYVERLQVSLRSIAQPVRELSGGNQQKIVLAKWLMTEPSILILDEPTRGVDVGAKAEVHALMRELADKGMAILMVSSDLPEVLSMSDRVLVMRKGRIVAEMSRDEANSEAVMFAATGQVTDAA